MATRRERNRAATVVRRLLEAVDRGDLDADTPQGRRLLRRLEGALAAWEVSRPRRKGAAEPNE